MAKKTFFEVHKKIFILGIIVLAVLVVAGVLLGGRGYLGTGEHLSVIDEASFAPSALYERAVLENGSIIPPPEPSLLGETVQERKIVKNGSLSLVVKKTEDVIGKIKNIAVKLGGFVEYSNVYETGENKKAGSITIRVPAAFFDGAMNEIKTLAIKVERENVGARDVTEQFIDLEIRLQNMKAEEEQYRDILKRAVAIEDVLNVTARLSEVRQRIERAQGQMDYLSRQIKMSTISVSLISEADVEIFGVVWSPIATVKQALRDGLQAVVIYLNILIGIFFKLPAYLLWIATIILAIWGLWKLVLLGRRYVGRK
ncbi:MAG: hypothetical protein BMS9Abin13_263 [Patescibacteria group bacterium]|nr:MAG: hypothetical protein BMS9Abin13_263 [Patescibacteria group bacterium]